MPGFGSLAPGQDTEDGLIDWSRMNQPYGTIGAASFSPSQGVQHTVQDALIGMGAQPPVAGHLAQGVTGLLQNNPVVTGPMISGANVGYYGARRDIPQTFMSALGAVPGLAPEVSSARNVAQWIGRKAVQKAGSGMVQSDLAQRPNAGKSLVEAPMDALHRYRGEAAAGLNELQKRLQGQRTGVDDTPLVGGTVSVPTVGGIRG